MSNGDPGYLLPFFPIKKAPNPAPLLCMPEHYRNVEGFWAQTAWNMRTADPGECKCTKTWVPVTVTCRICADVNKGNDICGVPGHPDPATCCLCCKYLCWKFMLHRHIPVVWWRFGLLCVDPKDKCLVLWKEQHFKNLKTAISAVRMLYMNKARPSCFLKALGKHPQACCLMDYPFQRALCCQCLDQEPVHWGSAELLRYKSVSCLAHLFPSL